VILRLQKPLSSIFFATWRCLSGLIEWLFLLRQGFGRLIFRVMGLKDGRGLII
jgi:hypothetical protein